MTYDQDPARWTSSPEEAPELLRGAFAAGRNEGPNPAQMRSLAFKIAAVSAGGAVAVGAAKATAAGNAAATAATWSLGKLAGVLAVAGGLAAGAVIWKTNDNKDVVPAKRPTSAVSAAPHSAQPSSEPSVAPATNVQPRSVTEPAVAPTAAAPAAGVEPTTPASPGVTAAVPTPRASSSVVAGSNQRSTTSERVTAPSSAPRKAVASQRSSESSKATITASNSAPRTISEVELLRSAQQALRGRPREAFQLTEQHRQLYPTGEFAQERDALAIQALLRAGESEMARDLAVSFIKAHPSSPHAHRFREAMGIR